MNGRPIAPAMMRFVITTFEYSYAFTLALADRLLDDRPEEEEPDVELRDAARADEQRRRHPRELRAEPEVLLLLPDHLADQRRRPALEVVALVHEVVAVGDEASRSPPSRTSASATIARCLWSRTHSRYPSGSTLRKSPCPSAMICSCFVMGGAPLGEVLTLSANGIYAGDLQPARGFLALRSKRSGEAEAQEHVSARELSFEVHIKARHPPGRRKAVRTQLWCLRTLRSSRGTIVQ